MRGKFVFLLILLVGSLAACSTGTGAMEVKEPWARPGLAGGNTAIYFVLKNGSSVNDKLLSAESSAAMMVQVHMSSMDANGVMSMQEQEFVPVPAGAEVAFKPGGLHIMLMNLPADLKPGQDVQVTLNFENAGQILVSAPVREP